MNVLALDLGTSTGWAYYNADDGTAESGVQVFDVKRGESRGMRYMRFRKWLEETWVRMLCCDLWVYEQTHHRGGDATEVAAGMATRVQELAALASLDYAAIHSATLKKWATGKGNAGKGDMIDAAANIGQRLPQLQRLADEFMVRWNEWCDKEHPNKAAVEKSPFTDEADAICLLGFALSELVPAGGEAGGRGM